MAKSQPGIAVGVTPRASGDGHLSNNPGKNLPPFGVLSPFMALDSRPVTMSAHGPLRSAVLPRPAFRQVRSCGVVQVPQRLEGVNYGDRRAGKGSFRIQQQLRANKENEGNPYPFPIRRAGPFCRHDPWESNLEEPAVTAIVPMMA